MRVSLLIAAVLLCGCPATGDEVRPPSDQFFFPTGLTVAPDDSVMFVVNANSDLRFDSGAMSVVDLGKVSALVDGWLDRGEFPVEGDGNDLGCEVDLATPYTLVCNEIQAVVPGAGVRIGNFGTEVAVQTLASGALRVFAAVRGDPSLTWMDYDGALACGDAGKSFPECDDEHRLTRMRNDPDLFDLPDEPFGVYVDSTDGFAIVTHLTDGAVTLADAPLDGAAPVLADAIGGLFAADPQTNVRGAAGVAGRLPGSSPDRIYVTSRSEARVQILTVARPGGGYPVVVPGDFFFINRVRPSDDGRGIAFSADGDRAYIVNRDPPVLQIIDTSLTEGGIPANELVAAVELCQQASNLVVSDGGAGERVYVGCFRAGQVWVVDPIARRVEAILDVGRGPYGVAAAPSRGLVLVSNFLEDTVSVIDVRADRATQNRVVLRLGRARQEGGR
jgi:hypothetical protein